MNDDVVALSDLPPYWQEQVRKLRSENRNLRIRLREMTSPLEAPRVRPTV